MIFHFPLYIYMCFPEIYSFSHTMCFSVTYSKHLSFSISLNYYLKKYVVNIFACMVGYTIPPAIFTIIRKLNAQNYIAKLQLSSRHTYYIFQIDTYLVYMHVYNLYMLCCVLCMMMKTLWKSFSRCTSFYYKLS